MTVAELIEQLQKLPGDWTVYVEGYEDGYDDISELRTGHFDRNVGDGLWAGPHYRHDGGLDNGVALVHTNSGRL